MSRKNRVIVVGVTGSIAAYKAAEIVSCLVKEGVCVKVVMTKASENFITPLTFARLSGHKVYSEMFDDAGALDVEHVALADSADLVLIAPATANIIGKIASGISDDFLTCVVMATKAPILIAPAMNEGMYTSQIVEANIEKLKKAGCHFIGPEKGRLACGSEGVGRLCDVEKIARKAIELTGVLD